jgi:dihydrolipoamide dehydrogenase
MVEVGGVVTGSYDAVVIGGGPAGEQAAGRLARGGLSVVVVEKELVGGECSYWVVFRPRRSFGPTACWPWRGVRRGPRRR